MRARRACGFTLVEVMVAALVLGVIGGAAMQLAARRTRHASALLSGPTLPGGRLVICRGAPGAPIVIKLGWHGKNPDGSAAQDGARHYPPGVALMLTGAAK